MDNLRFTGGDNLSGIKKVYHLVMMENELVSGYNAYKLSFAAKGNSGFSFGGNQMDLSVNKKAQEVFSQIIRTSNKLEIGTILSKMAIQGKSPEEAFGNDLVLINSLLASDFGIKLINQSYIDEVNTRSLFIENIINEIYFSESKKFYDSNLGRALLFDYHNQYGISEHGKLIQYINGHKILTFNNKELNTPIIFTLDSHESFIFSLKYACDSQNNYNDAMRRINNIVWIICQSIQKIQENEQCQHRASASGCSKNCLYIKGLAAA